jgi:hypothetical protein
MNATHALLFTWGECVRLNGCSEVSLMEDMREHVQESSEKFCCNLTYTVREMNSIHTPGLVMLVLTGS